MRTRNETSGLVWMSPYADTSTSPTLSCTAPLYFPFGGSNVRKPPPVTTPASILKPAPDGNLNCEWQSTGPRFPSVNDTVARSPKRSTVTFTGPNAARAVALTSSGTPLEDGEIPTWRLSTAKPPSDRATGMSTLADPEPSKTKPCAPDQRTPKSNL